ncbi:MAG: bifunctional 5,10-methylenetetrahydrofolate dehydrogenase/5,10-methenyltetrahydrofolate cyclohydrolase [Dehalococcoidia bacterium]|nr:bifunctional 5,10-methylenetetrahydrofolate dehydrogenase/5,10-methenyltetrahydrofolate cyclohydrolase [Dehalococcoidia bacterium]
MAARIIDGAAIAAEVRAEIAERVRVHVAAGRPRPKLVAVIVGDDPASQSYVRGKTTGCAEAGMDSDTILLPASTSHAEVLATVERLNADATVSGILVQLPLPPQVDEQVIVRAIDPRKDVDGLHPYNLGLLLSGQPYTVPATPLGVQQLLLRTGNSPEGKRVVIVGRSLLVGRPLAALLSNKAEGANATVTLAHTGTRDLASVTREAEILIVAAGRPRMVDASMVRPGTVVIDVGINRLADPSRKSGSRLVGDVDYASVVEVASAITPVPGGVGPMTVAMVIANTLRAAGS